MRDKKGIFSENLILLEKRRIYIIKGKGGMRLILKSRKESLELQIYRSLHNRMHLTEKEKNHYCNLEKGFEGEQIFDKHYKELSEGRLILNDLLFECNHSIIQIDSLVINPQSIYLFEVKNFEGDFLVEGDRWYSLPKFEIKNPLLQLKRAESLFRRLLQDLRVHYPIESHLIFVNPEFYLYQILPNLPIIFPNQINRFIKNEKKKPVKLTEAHTKLAEKLLSIHLNESPYSRIPKYEYKQVKKGILCPKCYHFYPQCKSMLICKNCGAIESFNKAVNRSTDEYKLLFPNNIVTTNNISVWCNLTNKHRLVQKILSTNFIQMGYGKSVYYQ